MGNATRRAKSTDKLQRLLIGQKCMLGLSFEELAAEAGVSKTTAHRLMQRPEGMSLIQLRAFCKALQLRGDDIRDLIPLP